MDGEGLGDGNVILKKILFKIKNYLNPLSFWFFGVLDFVPLKFSLKSSVLIVIFFFFPESKGNKKKVIRYFSNMIS